MSYVGTFTTAPPHCPHSKFPGGGAVPAYPDYDYCHDLEAHPPDAYSPANGWLMDFTTAADPQPWGLTPPPPSRPYPTAFDTPSPSSSASCSSSFTGGVPSGFAAPPPPLPFDPLLQGGVGSSSSNYWSWPSSSSYLSPFPPTPTATVGPLPPFHLDSSTWSLRPVSSSDGSGVADAWPEDEEDGTRTPCQGDWAEMMPRRDHDFGGPHRSSEGEGGGGEGTGATETRKDPSATSEDSGSGSVVGTAVITGEIDHHTNAQQQAHRPHHHQGRDAAGAAAAAAAGPTNPSPTHPALDLDLSETMVQLRKMDEDLQSMTKLRIAQVNCSPLSRKDGNAAFLDGYGRCN